MGLKIGALHVRRSIMIDAPPDEVWREFSSLNRISAWLNQGHTLHRLDLHPDGNAEFSVEIDGEERFFGGRVLVFDETRELSFESQWQGSMAWPVPTFWTFLLTPLYGGTLVELFHHGFERLGADAAANLEDYERGWTVRHLATLRAIVEG